MIYTQLNQYYVVLEVAPQFFQSPDGLNYIYPRATGDGLVTPLSAVSTCHAQHHPAAGQPYRACSLR